MPDRLGSFTVKQLAGPCKQELQMVIELGHRSDSGPGRTHRIGLVNRDGRWYAFDLVDCRFVHAVQKLAGIGRKGFDIPPLAFGIERVKHQT